MSMGMGPGNPGPVTMGNGGGPTSGLPTPPPRAHGRLRWFGLGMTTGVVGTLVVVIIVATLTH
ncbi:hypothetical protein OSC27_12740 [Microbacterium sp. STN6]|uniref:hypothetical protein n=1 Tax=Microbacterium sp. STN6 TaxID=2995588 RepID=UPI002260F2A8|nr:hypothetical protein [Microbacterium sp. STN6]MCX7523139.1 hypothetical protein [Microbacterium sp. STN6]